MIHLEPLPGAPGFGGDMNAIVVAAVRDATTLADAGFDGLMVENFGDAPFFAEDVPKTTVAAMASAVGAVISATTLPTGVNVLRNDAAAALAIAAATGAGFIRVNVLSGTMFTDQGPIVGRAAAIGRMRAALCPDVAILADVFVKHATPPAGLTLEAAAKDLSARGGADAIVVSGPGTGSPADPEDLEVVRAASALPVFVGSGVDEDTVGALLTTADGAIVGTAVKSGGVTTPVDAERAAAVVAAARA